LLEKTFFTSIEKLGLMKGGGENQQRKRQRKESALFI
jgi:hypothetical protein